MSSKNQFSILDYSVFAASLAIFLVIGLYHNRKYQKDKATISEFFTGSGKMHFLPVSISLMVTYQSSILMLGFPGEVYVYGVQIFIQIVSSLIFTLVTIQTLVPLLHSLQVTSIFEYLEMRFQSKAIYRLAAILSICQSITFTGAVAYGPAIALETVTGFPMIAALLCGVLSATIYTCLGGFKTVIWTDCLQFLIMVSGILAVLIQGTIYVGGTKTVWGTAQAGGRLNFFNLDLNPTVRHTFWALIFSNFAISLEKFLSQSSFQRIKSTKTAKSALRMSIVSASGLFLTVTPVLFKGLIAYAYYDLKKCDPFESGQINNPNQIIPYMIMEIFESVPGMPGLFLAAVYSAALSTVSSSLSSLSVTFWKDIISPLVKNVTEVKATLIARLSVLLFGAAVLGSAFLMTVIGGPLTQLLTTVTATFDGPLTSLYILAFFFPRVKSKGALLGTITSLLVTGWIALGKSFTKTIKPTPWLPPASTDNCPVGGNGSHVMMGFNSSFDFASNTPMATTATPNSEIDGISKVYTVSYLYLKVIPVLTSLLVAVVTSYFTGMNKPGDVDPSYLISVTDTYLFFLPKVVRQRISSIGPQFIKEATFPNPEKMVEGTSTLGPLLQEQDNKSSPAMILGQQKL